MMTNQKWYCDNEITGERVYRDEKRFYPIHLQPEDPPIWIQGLWVLGGTVAAITFVIFCFVMVK